jgi:hypothetical protein
VQFLCYETSEEAHQRPATYLDISDNYRQGPRCLALAREDPNRDRLGNGAERPLGGRLSSGIPEPMLVPESTLRTSGNG